MTKKHVAVLVISFVFTFVIILLYSMNHSGWNDDLFRQTQEIDRIKNEIAIKESANEEAQSSAMQTATGLDDSRVSLDNQIAETFLKEVMTWDTHAEYTAIRDRLKTDYGMDEESRFLQVFMPEVVVATANDGTEYNRIDTTGLNVRYERMDTYVTAISANIYSYFSFVTWSAHDSFGNTAETTAIFTYDINAEGVLSNINAYTISDVDTSVE